MMNWFAKLSLVMKVGWYVLRFISLVVVSVGLLWVVWALGTISPDVVSLALSKGGYFVRGIVSLGVVLFLLVLFLLLRRLTGWKNLKNIEDDKDRVSLRIEIVKTAASILGGLFFILTIVLAFLNYRVAQEKHTTDLFTKAIEQLGGNTLEVRLGGIYALERIARDSEKDHGPIMEVLTAYVRENAPWPMEEIAAARKKRPWARERPGDKTKERGPAVTGKGKTGEPAEIPKLDADIQAVLMVIGRRSRTFGKGEAQPLDLKNTDMRGADLLGANLWRTHLWEANLEGADLRNASLRQASLWMARLQGANLENAQLEQAMIQWADFRKAIALKEYQVFQARCWPLAFFDASLLEALRLPLDHNERLQKGNLSGYNLESVDLRWAILGGFNLKQANLKVARLEGANFWETHIEGADLSGVWGLTQEQIDEAYCDEETQLPPYLKPSGKKRPLP